MINDADFFLEAVFELGFEHGMSENRLVSGAKTPEGLPPSKTSRRQNGRFSPYPCRTRRIFPLEASNPACGVRLHGVVFSYSGGKCVSRRARNPIQRQPLKLRGVIDKGWMPLPDRPGYRGSGGPGLFLESMIGIDPNNRDGPDAGAWELKYHSGSAPITLFHLTPQPKGNMHRVVRFHGWDDGKGRISVRHTIWGRSTKGFRVVSDSNWIIVCHEENPSRPARIWRKSSVSASQSLRSGDGPSGVFAPETERFSLIPCSNLK